jgi:hypothetical protein
VSTLYPFCESDEIEKPVSAQVNVDGSIHNWYRMRLGFSDHLVASLIQEFQLSSSSGTVLDAFCGAGTTLVESKKLGITSIGVDANPASVFASRVKTTWNLDPKRLRGLLDEIDENCQQNQLNYSSLMHDSTYQYLDLTGLIKRGWICVEPLLEAIALKQAISNLGTSAAYKNFFMLALVTEIVEEASNVRFGPELYCGPRKVTSDILDGFADRAETMIDDIQSIDSKSQAEAHVFEGDSRSLRTILDERGQKSIGAIICSPPYPAEHDYTRNTRLELAFLDQVYDKKSLQTIKKAMVRCHTKGIYKDDNDSDSVEHNLAIRKIVDEVGKRAQSKTHGFARLYVKVIREYFGGMRKHFESARQVLKPRAICAYVVGDQSSYLQVHIPTATLLAALAKDAGFECLTIKRWRTRRVNATKKSLDENVLILRRR